MARIARLSVAGIRNLADVSLSPHPRMTLIVGDNGAGKTALLESIHLLATGRSFRDARVQRCVQWQSTTSTIFAEVVDREVTQRLGWQRQQSAVSLRVNGATVATQAALAAYLPVQVFSPESQHSLIHGPSERRRFLDWGAFYQHDDFLMAWRDYHHALRQRNHAIRQQLPDAQVWVWSHPLWQAAQKIHQVRSHYVTLLSEQVARFSGLLSEDLSDLSLRYASGWSDDVSLWDRWQMQLAQDRSVGYTQSGPHRADLKMSIQGRDALTVLSRGQQKLLTLMLLLSQAALLTQVMQTSPIVLLDDLSAELDERHRQKVLDVLANLSVQTFLTATDAHHLNVGQDAVRWSVDDGRVHVIENRPKAV